MAIKFLNVAVCLGKVFYYTTGLRGYFAVFVFLLKCLSVYYTLKTKAYGTLNANEHICPQWIRYLLQHACLL